MAGLKKPVILSTGMSNLAEIEDALSVLDDGGCEDVTLLHCNTEYPTPMADVNLLAMRDLEEQFGLPVGFSDHTLGIEADIAAAALGACVIEKHFTLDRAMDGPDHQASLTPDELAAMVRAVRNIEQAWGDGHKHVTDSEAKNKAIARKSIVARRPIAAGEAFTAENLTTKRPGDGVCPMRWYEVLGQKAKRDFAEDEDVYKRQGLHARLRGFVHQARAPAAVHFAEHPALSGRVVLFHVPGQVEPVRHGRLWLDGHDRVLCQLFFTPGTAVQRGLEPVS